jgi:NADH-quinone oxidoreductase subunit L
MPSSFAWTPLFPLVGALLSSALVGRSSPRVVTMIGVGAALLSLGTVIVAAAGWDGAPLREDVWIWLDVGGVAPIVTLRCDALALWACGLTAGLGLAVQVHAAGSLSADAAYSRFVTASSLLLSATFLLFLADNLLVLFVGWEVASLAAYLLTGLWWEEHANGAAARKGLVLARVADVGLLLAIFLLLDRTGTLELSTIASQASMSVSGTAAEAAAVGVLVAVMGRCAQMPLHTGLLAASTGPAAALQPVLALAGPYLVARLHPVFLLSPLAMHLVAAVGAVSLLLGGLAALGQQDIRRVLAFATTAAFGFVLVGLGAGGWAASIAAAGLIAGALTVAALAVGSARPAPVFPSHDAPGLGTPGILAFGVATLVLFGAPPLPPGASGDVAAAVASGAPVWLAPLGIGAIITTFAMVRALAAHRGTAPTHAAGLHPWTPLLAGLLLLIPLVAVRTSPIAPGLLPGLEAPFPRVPPASALVRASWAVAMLAAVALAGWIWGVRRASWTPPAVLARGFGFEDAEEAAIVRPALFLLGEDRRDAATLAGDGLATAIRAVGRLHRRILAGDARWIVASAIVVATIVVLLAELR